MGVSRRGLNAVTASLPLVRARAQSPKIRLGVLNDQSGPYRDVTGTTSIACARQAVQDFDAADRGLDVEVISADHQNKPDIGAAIALHYLKAVVDMGVAEAKRSGTATVARMKAMPTDDDAFGQGSIRQDGRGVFPAYLFQVKAPGESKGPWDLYKLLVTTPASEALRPLGETNCTLVRS